MVYRKSIQKQGAGLTIQESEDLLKEALITLLSSGFKFTGKQENVMRTSIKGYLVLDFQKELKEIVFEPSA